MNRVLRNIGFLLVLLGASSFFFPMIGFRSRIMSAFGENEKIAAGVALGVGAVVLGLSFRGKKKEEQK
jgi:arginine exporter protein ArgO